MLRGQINTYLPPGHPKIKMAAVYAKRSTIRSLIKVPMKQKIPKAYLKDLLKKGNMVFSFIKYLISLGRY